MTINLAFNEVFNYLKIVSGNSPIIQVQFTFPGIQTFSFPLLVDSGASYTQLPLYITTRGIDISNAGDMQTVGVGGGAMNKIVQGVRIQIGQKRLTCPILFDTNPLGVINKSSYGLLGRENVFQSVKIGFRAIQNQVLLAHTP